MFRLFQLLKRFNYVILFILLQVIAFSILFYNNYYHHSKFFNALNEMSGSFHQSYYNTTKYLDLSRINDSLLLENARLKSEISKLNKTYTNRMVFDTNANYGFVYKPAHVINSTVDNRNNFMTLDIGSKRGAERLMGVVSYDGVVGLIKNVSPNFSNVNSILNSDFKLNAKIKEVNEVGSVTWDGHSIYHVVLLDIPNNVEVKKGQHVVVGPFSGFFPEDYPIGIVDDFEFMQGGSFYKIRVRLQADIKNSTSVYIVKRLMIEEQLELESKEENE